MSKSLQKQNEDNRLQVWMEKVSECRASGLSQSKWCEQNNIPKSTYSYRQQRVYEFLRNQQESQFVEVPVKRSNSLTINCGEISIEIPDSSDVSLIHNVIKALKSC